MRCRIILILSLLSALTLTAQPMLDKPEIQFGLQGGVTTSMVYFYPEVSQSALNPHIGGTSGIIFRYNGHKYCGLQTEFNWIERGWRESDTGYTRTLHYIEIPFLAHIYFGTRFRGYINLGPEIGYCLISNSHRQPEESARQYEKADNRFYWGAAGGLGMYAHNKTGCWQIEARFAYGLGTIFSNVKTDYFDYSNPMTLSLRAAWLWEFHRNK